MKPIHSIARITLETKTPLAINTGKQDGVFDTSLITDANGLPAIPATSITGVLRHLYEKTYEKEATHALFGFQEQSAKSHDEKGQISNITIGWGHLNDSNGKVIEGIDFEDTIPGDALLSSAFEQAMGIPLTRDRNVNNSRGVSINKFDVSILQQGHRFTFEMSHWAEATDTENGADSEWEQALQLLFHPLFRLGSNTRNGLGAVTVKQLETRYFDLRKEPDQNAFIAYSQNRTLTDTTDFTDELKHYREEAKKAFERKLKTISLTLEPTGFWRFGQGSHPQDECNKNKVPDLLPKMEESIEWKDGKGSAGDLKLLVAATSIKGAIAHRVAFHANRLNGVWADDKENIIDVPDYDKSEHCETIKRIFGYAANENRSEDDEEPGQVGALIINDAYIDFNTDDLKVIMHNAIDRFTAGVRRGMLFSEEMVWGKTIDLTLFLDEEELKDIDKEALHHALKDLAEGRLSLGARASVGHGFFKDPNYQSPLTFKQGEAE